jgi:hypothetical protein
MPGMAVVTKDGRGMIIADVVKTERTDATFNLTVADFETYFVGEFGVLVHNCSKKPGGGRNAQKANPDRVAALKKQLDAATRRYNNLRSKPNKTKADKAELGRAKRAMDSARQRMRQSENHSMRTKKRK